MSGLEFVKACSRDIVPHIQQLGALRIAVFREFPYLYEGSMEYETEYLKIYSESEKSILFAVYKDGQMIGATTGLPLAEEDAAVRKPFEERGWPVNEVFYFGESILLPEYRGKGLGHRFFDERERHALDLGFSSTAFCAVDRPADHPLKPEGYRPNDTFWKKRGYEKQPELVCSMKWPDVGEEAETFKTLTFWTKKWR
jgi:GNAT superfamily N-acetyltransferase